MKHYIVLDLERSERLHNLGFDEPCLMYHRISINVTFTAERIEGVRNSQDKDIIAMPAYQQVIDWFREAYKMFLYIVPSSTYDWWVQGSNGWYASCVNECQNMYEAMHDMIDTALDYLESESKKQSSIINR